MGSPRPCGLTAPYPTHEQMRLKLLRDLTPHVWLGPRLAVKALS